jgi:DNA polymerase III delta subunit
MIYILSGNDTKKKNSYLKKLCKDNAPVFVSNKEVTKNMILDYAHSVSLFGGEQIVVFEGLIKEESLVFSDEDLVGMKESPTIFVFMEEKLLAPQVKKYKKYATIEDFGMAILKQTPKMNMFDIADSFSKRDKVSTWILYRQAVSLGVQPEEISGIIFWKIKTMLLSPTKLFSPIELKKRSSELVSIYHKAHRGECDFIIGLEQFILSSLSKK